MCATYICCTVPDNYGAGIRHGTIFHCAIIIYLESLVNQLFLLTQLDAHPMVRQQAFRYLYLVSKVRGSKVMVRWFPHEVSDFDPVLKLLQQQDPRDYEVLHTFTHTALRGPPS